MKRVLVIALGVALVGICGPTSASCGKVWDDLSWWAQSDATPGPVKDATRSGYWWWPKEPASNADDSELWGNRGVVYGMYQEPEPPAPPAPAVPPPPPPAKPKRSMPVLNNVLFDFDKSNIRTDGKPIIDAVVKEMKAHPKDKVLIEGHTCNVGAEDYNMGLGQRRADAVKKYMVGNGINASRISTKSFGESKPVSAESNATPDSRKQNRRGIFVLTMGD